MDNLFEQITNITKAHGYDILSKQVGELKEQNKKLITALKAVEDDILQTPSKDIVDNPNEIIMRISKIVRTAINENRNF